MKYLDILKEYREAIKKENSKLAAIYESLCGEKDADVVDGETDGETKSDETTKAEFSEGEDDEIEDAPKKKSDSRDKYLTADEFFGSYSDKDDDDGDAKDVKGCGDGDLPTKDDVTESDDGDEPKKCEDAPEDEPKEEKPEEGKPSDAENGSDAEKTDESDTPVMIASQLFAEDEESETEDASEKPEEKKEDEPEDEGGEDKEEDDVKTESKDDDTGDCQEKDGEVKGESEKKSRPASDILDLKESEKDEGKEEDGNDEPKKCEDAPEDDSESEDDDEGEQLQESIKNISAFVKANKKLFIRD